MARGVFPASSARVSTSSRDDEIVVRFVVRHVPHADELRMPPQFFELPFAVGTRQVEPTNDARNEIVFVR